MLPAGASPASSPQAEDQITCEEGDRLPGPHKRGAGGPGDWRAALFPSALGRTPADDLELWALRRGGSWACSREAAPERLPKC